MKKQLIILSVALLTLSVHAAKQEKIKTAKKLLRTMNVGDSVTLKDHSHLTSSNKGVITVSGQKNNVLTAVGAGHTTIMEHKKGKKRKHRKSLGQVQVVSPSVVASVAQGTKKVVEGTAQVVTAPLHWFESNTAK